MHCRRSHRDADSIPFTSLGVGEPPMGGFSRDLQLVGLASECALELADLAAQLALTRALLLTGQRLPARLEDLVAPPVVERLGDSVLAADIADRSVAAHPRQHDLQLLLRRPAAVLALLAQPSLLVGRAAHAEPDAGQPLRGLPPPPSLPGPSQLTVNTGPGSGPFPVKPPFSIGAALWPQVCVPGAA